MAGKITEKTINKAQFEQMINLGMSEQEIADFFMVTTGRMYGWIKLVYNTKHPYMLIKKMRVQAKYFFVAEQRMLAKKNPTQSIWLGKNYFGQTEVQPEIKPDEIDNITPIAKQILEYQEQLNKEPNNNNEGNNDGN